MKKTLKKLLAAVLALTVLFTVPVMAFAASDYFDFTGSEVAATSGTWKDDYVGNIKITLFGDARKSASSDFLCKVLVNGKEILTLQKSDVKISFSGNKTVIEFALNKKINHADNYVFEIAEGAFTTAFGKINAAYETEPVSGNLILNTLDIADDELPKSPIEQLIVYLESLEYSFLLYPVIFILKFFVAL